ncbi:hypothetical protein EDD16DRAFT_262987 [Pisolithus croceorrhizus]|nr:hypothetical protein EDD16DRAFT_262987 [Pisolithus croceorrhizus]
MLRLFGLVDYAVRGQCRLIPPRQHYFSAIHLGSVSVGDSSSYGLPQQHGRPGRVWFYPCRQFGLLHIIWHNNSTGTYVYYMHNSEDASTTKFVVAAVWVLDTLHVLFICHMEYYYLITNWGVPTSLEYIVWSFPALVLVDVLLITIVQVFFARTIYCLCRRQLRLLVTVPIVLLVIVHIGFALAAAIVMLVNNATSFASYTRFYTVTPAASAIALAEVLITMSLCVLLHESGSHSAVPRTKRLLNSLIIYAVNRCLLTFRYCSGRPGRYQHGFMGSDIRIHRWKTIC